MNGFINMFSQTYMSEVPCIFIYAAKRKKRYGSNDRRGYLKNRVCIDQRPHVVEEKSRVGDWEADTIIGKAH